MIDGENLIEINFDFNHNYMLLYQNPKVIIKPYTRTKERMLSLITDILYFLPHIQFKLGNPFTGAKVDRKDHPTNLRLGGSFGDRSNDILLY